VLGPASAESRLLVEAAEEAGAGWAAWRLGMLWTCLIADKTGEHACRHARCMVEGDGSGQNNSDQIEDACLDSFMTCMLLLHFFEMGLLAASFRVSVLTRVTDSRAGAKSWTEFQLQELYIDSARGNFFPPSR